MTTRNRIFRLVAGCLFLLTGTGCGPDSVSGDGGGDAGGGDEPQALSYWDDPAVRKGLFLESRPGSDGTSQPFLCLGDSLYYATGVNCYDLFNGSLKKEGERYTFDIAAIRASLDILKAQGVPVVRFNCGIYHAAELPAYFENRDAYLAALREVAGYAEEQQIGLIPSVIWNYHSVSEHYGEPLRKWGDAASATFAFLQSYTQDVVRTMQSYKSIFAWEFGNEFNLGVDLPNWQEIFQTTDPADWLKGDDLHAAYRQFAETVRANDPERRLILSGNAGLRPSQYHQYRQNSWTDDNVEQYGEITAYFTPDPMDCVSEHLYDQGRRFAGLGTVTLDEQVRIALQTARSLGKGYVVGEFLGEAEESVCRLFYEAFLQQGVQLSLVWNFARNGNIEHSFTADEPRGQMLFSLAREYNARYAEQEAGGEK